MLNTIIRNTLIALPLACANSCSNLTPSTKVERAKVESAQIQTLKTQSGLKFLLVEDYTVPLVALAFSFKGGSTQDREKMEGTANILSTMLDEGAGEFKSEVLQSKIEDSTMRYSFNASRDRFSGSMKSLNENLDESADLMKLMITKPRFDGEPLKRMLDAAVQTLKYEQTNPDSLSSKAIRESVFANHPYQRAVKGTLQTVENISPEILRNYHKKIFAKDNLTIGIVGAINGEAARQLVEKIFGELPQKSELLEIKTFNAKIGEVKHIDFDVPQTNISFVLSGVNRHEPDFYAAVLANHILGGRGFNSRFFKEVREKRGLAYSVYSALLTYDSTAIIQAGAATETKRVAETIEIMKSEIKKMATDGPSEQELQDAKNYIIGSYGIQNLDTSDKIASVLVALQDYELGIDYIEKRERYFNEVSHQDIKRISKKLFENIPSIITVGKGEK